MTRSSITNSLAFLALYAPLSGCFNLPADDASERANITWATQAIIGRAPSSPQELNALLELERLHGREALLDTLMQQPEFVDHWDDLLMNQLQVRTDHGAQARARKETCYTESYVPQQYDWALTQHLRSANWNEPFCVTSNSASDDLTLETGGRTAGVITEEYTGRPITDGPGGFTTRTSTTTSRVTSKTQCFEFTMKDVIRASLRTDRMDALLRARLVPLASFDNPTNARRVVFDAYFDRHQDCMECHTTTYSTTNPVPRNGNWDRYHPAVTEVDLEFSAFWTESDDGTIHDGSIGGGTVNRRFRDLFSAIRADEDADEDGVAPWSFDETCVNGAGLLEHPNDGSPAFAGWGGQTGNDVRILDFIDAFDDGLRALADDTATLRPRADLEGLPYSSTPSSLTACYGCHPSSTEPELYPGYGDPVPLTVEALTHTMSAERLRRTITAGSGGGTMPGQSLDEATRETIVAHLMTEQGDAVQIYDDPTVGMAHLAAISFVDGIAEQLSGRSLTLSHGFPRNSDQAYALRQLSDGLVNNDWSLRYVIKTIALSELVNRNAPADSTNDPYVLPMLVDPWQDTPADDDANPLTGVASNGQGDLVHRWPVATLIRKRNAALGWSQRTHFDDEDLRADLGGYVDFETPGFSGFDMAAALAWEFDSFDDGNCISPYGDATDVIDTLVDPAYDLTLAQALQTLKFRLLGEAIERPVPLDDYIAEPGQAPPPPAEYTVLAGEFGVHLSSPASQHEAEIRQYCDVLLASPQFVLAGLPTEASGPPEVDADIPCLDDRCDEGEWCDLYRHHATELGYESWTCPGDPIDDWTW